MIRVYLTVKPRVDEVINEIDVLDVMSSSFHYDDQSENIMIIIEGNQADSLSEYMLPPYLLTTEISTLSTEVVTGVVTELQNRSIITSGSITVNDLLDNILKTFNSAHKTLGGITKRDFS